jgi:hypothetical protein
MLVVLGLLLALDLGRSVYTRLGYARPTEIWQPAPVVYADLTWPPGADLPIAVPVVMLFLLPFILAVRFGLSFG